MTQAPRLFDIFRGPTRPSVLSLASSANISRYDYLPGCWMVAWLQAIIAITDCDIFWNSMRPDEDLEIKSSINDLIEHVEGYGGAQYLQSIYDLELLQLANDNGVCN